jgi:hypothetical protein
MNMKALPKLMKNSWLTVCIVSEEMGDFNVVIQGTTSWPSVVRFNPKDRLFHFFDCDGKEVLQLGSHVLPSGALTNFGLVFIGTMESNTDLVTKSQTIVAKMRAINLDSHEALHGDNWGYDE